MRKVGRQESRRQLLKIAAVAACIFRCAMVLLVSAPIPTRTMGAEASGDELQTWIAEKAIAVRTIDPADEDFSDLEPLVNAIGTAEVVQLGEVSHGAGNSFSAKVRLIKFLHRRMGFDVLVWESGMHGMRQAQAGMRAGDDALAAGQQGIFPIWSHTEEVRPLFEYVKASQLSTRPLEMAGFDMQFTAPKAREHFAADLRALVAAVPQPAIRRQAQEFVEEALTSHERLEDPKLESKSEDVEKLRTATGALLKLIADHRALFAQTQGSRETSFMECAIENLRTDGEGQLDLSPVSTGRTNASFRNMDAYFSRRDGQNARNFRWLVEKGYPGRKIIVWAHNVHITYAHIGSRFSSIDVEARPGDLKPMGAYLHEWLGRKVYTIGLTTFEGSDGWVTSATPVPLPPVMKDSLESHLHAVGKPYLFLDLRRLSTFPDHPLRQRQSMRIFVPVVGADTAAPAQGNYTIDDITQIFDGVFYIDRTTPATLISRGEGPK